MLFGTGFAVYSVLQLMTSSLRVPPSALRRIAGPMAINVASLDYLCRSSGSKVWLSLAWIMLIYGLVAIFNGVVRIALDRSMLRMIYKTYRSGHPLRLATPLVFVFAEPGIGPWFAYQLVSDLTNTLYKLRRKALIYALVSDTVSKYEPPFQQWLVDSAAALMVVRLPPGYSSAEFVRTAEDYTRRSLGKIFVTYLQVSRQAMFQGAKYCELDTGITEATLYPASLGRNKTASILTTLTDQVATVTLPLAASDTRISDEQRHTVRELAESGLAPVADSYFRFRLSKSDVERLLCLLDCIEVLLKCSVIVLVVVRWMQSQRLSDDATSWFDRPTLGKWIELLRQRISAPTHGSFHDDICNFWQNRITHVQRELIDHLTTSGMEWRGDLPDTHVQWLDWFVWFRNVTRGHGILDDKLASPIWHNFHEVFLQLAAGLHVLVFGTALLAAGAGTEQPPIKGWLRRRTPENGSDKSSFYRLALLHNRDRTLWPVYPFIVGFGRAILLWNSIKGNMIELVDYGGGTVHHLPVSKTNTYRMWHAAAASED